MSNGHPALPPGTVTFGPDANCTVALCGLKYTVYEYRPSLAANLTFLILFGLAAIIHASTLLKWRTWFYACNMVTGCCCALLGYIGRVMMHYNPYSFTGFMIQIVCVACAPVFFTAAIYITLAATISATAPQLSRFSPRLLYWVFIPCDIVSLAFQGAGGGLSTSTSGSSQTGVDLALTGLSFQVFTIFIFCLLFADYLLRFYGKAGRAMEAEGSAQGRHDSRLKIFLACLWFSTFIIFVRCCYRLAELHQGYSGKIIHDQALFIALEGALIATASYTLLPGNPGFGLQNLEMIKEKGTVSEEAL